MQRALSHLDSLISSPVTKKLNIPDANSGGPGATSKDTATNQSTPALRQKRTAFTSPTTPFKTSGGGSLASMLSTPKAKSSASPKQTSTVTIAAVGESPLSPVKPAPVDSYIPRISILFLDEIDALGSHESHSLNQVLRLIQFSHFNFDARTLTIHFDRSN
jgi:hypothetical protein